MSMFERQQSQRRAQAHVQVLIADFVTSRCCLAILPSSVCIVMEFQRTNICDLKTLLHFVQENVPQRERYKI